MAPPTKRPRLYELDPEVVSAEFAKTLRNRLEDSFELVGAPLPFADVYEQAAYVKIRALIRFSQTGEGEDMVCTLEDLQRLWSTHLPSSVKKTTSATNPIGLVFLAAEARIQISKRSHVSARALGAVSDLSEAQIRNILGKKLNFARQGIPYKSARNLLENRGIAGFADQRKVA